MVPEVIFGIVLVCAPTKIINIVDSNDQFNTSTDLDVLITAKKRCAEIYKNAPCAKEFRIKKDEQGDRMYSIVCGIKDDKKRGIWWGQD